MPLFTLEFLLTYLDRGCVVMREPTDRTYTLYDGAEYVGRVPENVIARGIARGFIIGKATTFGVVEYTRAPKATALRKLVRR